MQWPCNLAMKMRSSVGWNAFQIRLSDSCVAVVDGCTTGIKHVSRESAHSYKQIMSLCSCEALIGRFTAYLRQKVEENVVCPVDCRICHNSCRCI